MPRKKKEAVQEEAVRETAEQTVELKPINTKIMDITIIGVSDLILNKMNKRNWEAQVNKQSDKSKTIRTTNKWEDLITEIHWRDELPDSIEYTEETLKYLLKNNAPCIVANGLKKSIADALYRNGLDKNKTKFMASVNMIAPGGLIPVRFAEHHADEKLMKPPMGSLVLAYQNRFVGWEAKFGIQYVDGGAYSADQILQFINLAGFGIGIGSGRNCGFGRYKIKEIGVEQ